MQAFARYALVLILVGLPDVAAAARRSPLEGQPAVRDRYELRTNRFELGPSIAFALNRTYRHAFMLGAKLEYHINDYLSFGTEVAAGIPFDTGLTGEISDSYPAQSGDWDALHSRLSDIKMAGDVRAVFTPFSGKLGIFSALFLAYDFYVFAGFGMALLGNDTDDAAIDEANEGFRPGFAWGLGLHIFANRFISVGIELKDLLFADNESGGDTTRGLTDTEQGNGGVAIVDGDDATFIHHFFAGLNVTFFLPTRAKITP